MRRFASLLLLTTLLPACGPVASQAPNAGTEPAAAVDQAFGDARRATDRTQAVQLGAAAVAAQISLFHVLASLTEATARDLSGGRPVDGRFTPDLGQSRTYEVDLAAGTGRVTAQDTTRQAIGLSYRFSREDLTTGLAYHVTELAGMAEGYVVRYDALTIRYVQVFDAAGRPVRAADGTMAWRVEVVSRGQLALGAAPFAAVEQADFVVPYPLPTADTPIGSLKLRLLAGNSTFEGVTVMTPATLRTTGAIREADGRASYRLSLDARGQVAITDLPNP